MRRALYHKLTLLLSAAFFTLEISSAWGNDAQAPGLPIARLALPTISSNIDSLVPTKTVVGSKVAETKKMLQDLQARIEPVVQNTRQEYENIILEANQYHKIIGNIEAKLQLGTTPANPQLVALRSEASQQLSQITHTLGGLGDLSQEFRNFSQQTQAINSQVQQTLVLPGAIDEDHAQLILIREELEQLNGKICQILNIMVANMWRQGQWLGAEKIHFEDLSLAIESGRFMMSSQRGPHIQEEIIPLDPIIGPSHTKPHHKTSHAPKKPHKPTPAPSKEKPYPKTLESEVPPTPPAPKEKPSPKKTQPQATPAPTKTLAPVAVESRPKIPSAPQEAPTPPAPEKAQSVAPMTDYATAANGRSPLGILNADQDIQSQKWYLFSSAKRGLTTPSAIIDIVNVVSQESPSTKGEEAKTTLVKLGLKPEQIRVTHATGESEQVGKVYVFGQ